MSDPLISVVIPAYNCARVIGRAIDSALKQKVALEILVLDDGDLVGIGTHESLLESCEVYQEIYYSQFPKEVTGRG